MGIMSVTMRQAWCAMLAQSFEPSQWFSDDGDEMLENTADGRDTVGGARSGGRSTLSRPIVGRDHKEDRQMWVYHTVHDERGYFSHFEVGYYSPDKTWHCESRHDKAEHAAARVHYLNGGAKG